MVQIPTTFMVKKVRRKVCTVFLVWATKRVQVEIGRQERRERERREREERERMYIQCRCMYIKFTPSYLV